MAYLINSIILLLCVNFSAQDMEDLVSVGKAVADMFGYTVDHVFNDEKNYPPIFEDVTFWTFASSESDTLDHQILLDDPSTFDVFDPSKKMGIATHGWTDSVFGGAFSRNELWVLELVRDWREYNDVNVIAMDWKRLANYDYITSAKEHTLLVGNYLAKLIEYLETLGFSLDNITVAGHSLGGQISGIAGNLLGGRLGLIVGMDAAQPLFTFPLLIDAAKRLDPSDAKFVQAIHTSCNTLGVRVNIGHADYYLNGGALQPLCLGGGLLGITDDKAEAIVCSHSRAYRYFTSSLNPANKFNAIECTNTADCELILPLIRGVCTELDVMGVHSNRVNGTFYVLTSGEVPYV